MSPVIFDFAALHARRARAAGGFTRHDFLLREMAERLAERLEAVTRRFPCTLEISAPRAALAPLNPPAVARWESGCIAADETLPYPPGAFDAIISCNALHWVNDLPGFLTQAHRCLKPGGLFLAVFPGGETLHELRDSWLQAELALHGGASPRVSPFVDAREASGLLQRARFALPVADVERLTVRYETPLALMQDLRGMGETNSLLARPKHFTRRATLLAAADHYRRHYAGPDGRIPATFDLLTLTGWKE